MEKISSLRELQKLSQISRTFQAFSTTKIYLYSLFLTAFDHPIG